MTQFKYLVLAFASILVSCQGSTPATDETDETSQGPLTVYASNYPLTYFAERIGGDQVVVHFPMASAGDPAYWEPVADTIIAMQQADLIVLNGATYEQWLMNASLTGGNVLVTSSAFTNELIASGETFSHSHGAEGEHEHSGTASYTWLDLNLALKQAEAIRDALIRRRPSNKALFEANFNSLKEDVYDLNKGFLDLNVSGGGNVIFSHPVYQYLDRAYGIHGESLHMEPGQGFTPEVITDIRKMVEANNVCCMIWEQMPLTSARAALNDLGVKSLVVSPSGGLPAQGDFIDVMRANLAALHEIHTDN